MRRTIAEGIVTSFFALSVCFAGHAIDNPEPRSVAMAKSEIDDEFFAFFVGLLTKDIEATYDLDTLLSAFPIYSGTEESTPINRLIDLSRVRSDATGTPLLSVAFDAAFTYPIPFDVLGYHPGNVEVSAVLAFEERSYASRMVTTDHRDAVELSPLYVLQMVSGRLFIDFDGIVDALAFGAFDDLDARTILLFRYRSDWYAILAGEGHNDRIHEWTFNLKSTKFMRRPPRPLRGVADQFVDVSR